MFKKLMLALYTSVVLGSTLLNKAKLFLIALAFPIRRLLGIKKSAIFSVELKKFNTRFRVYLTDGSDIGVLREMFIEEQYSVDLSVAPQTIVDLGSNVGFSVVYFKLKYPNARVYAFEPDPATFEKLKRNTAALSGVELFNMVIGSEDGTADFFVHPESSMSSSLIKRTGRAQPIKVVSKKLDTFLVEKGLDHIDLLKFDVEGAEFQIFKSFAKINTVETFIGELHLDLVGVPRGEFIDIFQGFEIKEEPAGNDRYVLTIRQTP